MMKEAGIGKREGDCTGESCLAAGWGAETGYVGVDLDCGLKCPFPLIEILFLPSYHKPYQINSIPVLQSLEDHDRYIQSQIPQSTT
jgi:hypothetical protein